MKQKKKRVIDEETKRNISETVKKRWQEKEYREKVSNAHRHELPEEWKKNISSGMVGIERSKKTRKKMSNYQSKRPKYVKQKQVDSWKNQWNSLSKEQQIKRLGKWIDAGHKANESGDYLKPSSIEIEVKRQLDMIGVKYVQQKRVNDGERNYFLDFYIPSLRLVVEVNGDYWHSFPDRINRDKMLEKYVKSTGRNIIFIWEHEIKDDWFWVGDYLIGGDANA